MSQDPYSNQPQNPYHSEPVQNPHEIPQGPYTTPPPYGYGQQQPNYQQQQQWNYQQQQQSYTYSPPQATPLPLEQAIKDLPSQYIKVLTKPSADTLAQEMGKASWNIFWVQLIGYALISAILSYVTSLIMPNPFNVFDTTTNPIVALLIRWGFTLGLTPFIIVSFLIGNGILYLIAKAFRGQGTFLAQGYASLLFGVPLGILSTLVSRVPLLGALVAFGVGIYAIVLRIFAIMAVHRLSGGKATAVVLIPIAVGIFLILLLFAVMIALIIAARAIH